MLISLDMSQIMAITLALDALFSRYSDIEQRSQTLVEAYNILQIAREHGKQIEGWQDVAADALREGDFARCIKVVIDNDPKAWPYIKHLEVICAKANRLLRYKLNAQGRAQHPDYAADFDALREAVGDEGYKTAFQLKGAPSSDAQAYLDAQQQDRVRRAQLEKLCEVVARFVKWHVNVPRNNGETAARLWNELRDQLVVLDGAK